MSLMHWLDAQFLLGVPEMDQTHREFVELLNQTYDAPADRFGDAFKQLLTHTEAHFANEERLMEQCRFPPIQEHQGEHRKVLAEMRHFAGRATGGNQPLARAYLKEGMAIWFVQHAITMDSALAGHVKRVMVKGPGIAVSIPHP